MSCWRGPLSLSGRDPEGWPSACEAMLETTSLCDVPIVSTELMEEEELRQDAWDGRAVVPGALPLYAAALSRMRSPEVLDEALRVAEANSAEVGDAATGAEAVLSAGPFPQRGSFVRSSVRVRGPWRARTSAARARPAPRAPAPSSPS